LGVGVEEIRGFLRKKITKNKYTIGVSDSQEKNIMRSKKKTKH